MATKRETLNTLFSAGFIAKGIVYILVGVLTLVTVLGFSGGGIEGPRGILKWVAEQPFGRILVGLLSAGLLGYALWRLYRGIADPLREGKEPTSVAKRLGYVGSGLVNGTLAVIGLRLAIMGGSSSSSGTSQQGMVANLLQESWGQWLVGIVGVIVIGVGCYQVYKGVKTAFVQDIAWRGISNNTIKQIGRYGFFARGLVFGIIGYFLIRAATSDDASEFKGTEGALEYLAANPYGLWLLGFTSAGLLLFGIFSVLKGWFGSIK